MDIKKKIIREINSMDQFHDFKYYKELKMNKITIVGKYTVIRTDGYKNEEIEVRVNVCPFFLYDHNVSVMNAENHYYKYNGWPAFFKDKIGRRLMNLNDTIADGCIQQRADKFFWTFKYGNYWIYKRINQVELKRFTRYIYSRHIYQLIQEYPEFTIKVIYSESWGLKLWVHRNIFKKIRYPKGDNDISWMMKNNRQPSYMKIWRKSHGNPW